MHGAQVSIGGVPIDELFGCPGAGNITVHPSKDLLLELEKLPAGAKVGLEEAPEIVDKHNLISSSIDIDGKKYDMATQATVYWQHVLNKCVERRLQPIFLDDAKFIRENTRKRVQARKLDRKSARLYHKSKKTYGDNIPQEVVSEGLREAYKLDQEAAYLHVIKREEAMLRKIAETNPDIVIMGAGHTEVFMANPKEVAKFGIKFDSYARESFEEFSDAMELLRYSEGPLKMSPPKLIQNPEPDPVTIADREQIIRGYNATTLGRILPNEKPDFIGTWDLMIPARGLFELYIANSYEEIPGVRKVMGNIEDVIGTAGFTGTITGNTFIFNKKYDSTSVNVGGMRGTLVYAGTLKNGKYEGTVERNNQPFLRFERESYKK